MADTSGDESGDAPLYPAQDATEADPETAAGDEAAERSVRELNVVCAEEAEEAEEAPEATSEDDEWTWEPWQIEQATIEQSLREALWAFADGDGILFRYVLFALLTTWRDEGTGLRVIPRDALCWIYCGETGPTALRHRLYNKETCDGIGDSGDVLSYLQGKLPDLEYEEYRSTKRCRLLVEDGLPDYIHRLSREHTERDEQPVYAVSGEAYNERRSAARMRGEMEERAEEMDFPSPTAERIATYMNDLPARRLTEQFQENLDAAFEQVEEMEIDVKLSKRDLEGIEDDPVAIAQKQKEKNEEQRDEYLKILKHIRRQAKPYYRPSRSGRTDRVFSLGLSILLLPSSVRTTLSRGLWEVDLASAHLVLTSWLWGAESVLRRLKDPDYDLWVDLIGHFEEELTERYGALPEKGSDLFEDIKGALKIALYSAVYGMHAPSIKGRFTRRMKQTLGAKAGTKLGEHPLIADLLEARDELRSRLKVGDTLVGPTDIEITIEQPVGGEDEDLVDPNCAMATIAQSCEQYLMEAIIDCIEEREHEASRNYLRMFLWLHDGAYLDMRYPKARRKDLERHLERRTGELLAWAREQDAWDAEGLPPARFDVTEIK